MKSLGLNGIPEVKADYHDNASALVLSPVTLAEKWLLISIFHM